jgi:hypothetical protein
MSVVTISQAWPAAGRPFTVAELDRMPDDGRRYELLDGALVVSPRPTTIHQFVAMRLLRALADACPDSLCVVPGPAVELGPQTEFDPDLASGPITVGRPFAVSIAPADLTRGLRH